MNHFGRRFCFEHPYYNLKEKAQNKTMPVEKTQSPVTNHTDHKEPQRQSLKNQWSII